MQFTIPGKLRIHIKLSKKCRKTNHTKMLNCEDCNRIFFDRNIFEKHEARKLSTKSWGHNEKVMF